MGVDDEYDMETVEEEDTVEYELEEDPYQEEKEEDASYQTVDEAFMRELEEQQQPYQKVPDEFIQEIEEQREKRREIEEKVKQRRSGTDIAEIVRTQREGHREIQRAAVAMGFADEYVLESVGVEDTATHEPAESRYRRAERFRFESSLKDILQQGNALRSGVTETARCGAFRERHKPVEFSYPAEGMASG